MASLVRITFRARTDEARARTKRLRKAIGKDVKQIMKHAAERKIVPAAERLAPSPARGTITARATTRSVYVTTTARGKRRRVVGLLEYGGTVRAHIRPRPAKRALAFRGRGGQTVFAAVVRGPRTYRAQRFIGRAVDRNRGPVLREIRREIPKAMRRHLGDSATVND